MSTRHFQSRTTSSCSSCSGGRAECGCWIGTCTGAPSARSRQGISLPSSHPHQTGCSRMPSSGRSGCRSNNPQHPWHPGGLQVYSHVGIGAAHSPCGPNHAWRLLVPCSTLTFRHGFASFLLCLPVKNKLSIFCIAHWMYKICYCWFISFLHIYLLFIFAY